MPTAIFSAIEFGIIYAIMALGVYLTFRILDFPDLTVDGSFVTGASISAILIVNGVNPIIATIAAFFAGFIAGSITGILNTVGKINSLLSGILMMIGLYSINLRIMGKSNLPLMNDNTVFKQFEKIWDTFGLDETLNNLWTNVGLGDRTPITWSILFIMIILTISIKLLTDKFLKTEIGLALRATGDNKNMIRSFSANTNLLTILGLGLSNAMVALSGGLTAQYSKFSDVGMGIGMIVIGLASVIIGESLFGTKSLPRITLAVIGGAIVYRVIITLALRVDFLETGDMKLITAAIVIIALIAPKILDSIKDKKRKKTRMQQTLKTSAATSGKEE
jgi:putative ABC transport system permease protein